MPDFDLENNRCDKALCRIAKGDCSALTEIYAALGRKIYFLALSMLRNDSDAEDVLGDTMLEVISSAARYTPGSNARAWVLAIARNHASKKLRDRRDDVDLDDCPPPTGDDDFSSYEILSLVRRTLTGEERRVVLLRYYGGYKLREIAEMSGESVETVKKRCQRALKKLKQNMS